MRSLYCSFWTACTAMILLLAGCAPSAHPPTPNIVVPSPTFTAIPTLTPVRAASAEVAATGTAGISPSSAPFYAEVTVDNANLRTQPGTTFPVRRLLLKGTRVQVLGHAPGGEWLYVQTDEAVTGWVLYWLVGGGHDVSVAPLVEPQNVQVIHGMVIDRAGGPVSGIGFAVTQDTGPNAPRTDGTSDNTGPFYAFLPASASGTWYISQVSVACTSNTMDVNCNCIGACGKADPESIAVTLPVESVLQFTWK